MDAKKKILIIADSELIAEAIKCHIKHMSDMDYEKIKALSYNNFRTNLRNFNEYDYIICDLFKQYGASLRAEGILAAKSFHNFDKHVIIYCFNLPQITHSPLIWDITSDKKFDDVLTQITEMTQEDFLEHIAKLEEIFAEALFSVDGH